MLDAFESPGEFWRPEHPQRRFGGVLRFDPIDGSRVQLLGVTPDHAPGSEPTFHGELIEVPPGLSSCATLLRCRLVGMTVGERVNTETWEAERVLVGPRPIATDQPLVTSGARAWMDALDAWWGETAVDIDRRQHGARWLTIGLVRHPPLQVQLDDGTVSFHPFASARHSASEVHVEQSVRVELAAAAPLTPEGIDHEWVRPLEYLFAFLAYRGSSVRRLEYVIDGRLFRSLVLGHRARERVHPFLIPWRSREDTARLTASWFRFVRSRRAFCDAWLGAVDSPPEHLETQLLLLFEAIRLFTGEPELRAALHALLDDAGEEASDTDALADRLFRARDQLFHLGRGDDMLRVHDDLQRTEWTLRSRVLRELDVDPAIATRYPRFVWLAKRR